MKKIQIFVVATFLVLLSACRKEDSTSSSTTDLPVSSSPKMTPIPTPTVTPTENVGIENGKIVFRYESDKDVLVDREEKMKWIDMLVPYVEYFPKQQFCFWEEEQQLEVLCVGTAFLPKEIEYDEMIEIIDALCYSSFLRYQQLHPETDDESVLFLPKSEMDMSVLAYSEYDFYEYKALTSVYLWEDDSSVTPTYEKQYGIQLDIIFY